MNHKQKTALTLIELLVATIILGIIMLGIAGIDIAMRQSSTGASRNALVAMQTSAIMLHMTKNAAQAHGNATDPGIAVAASALWLRQDTAQTPDNPADDEWFCYDINGSQLRFCPVANASSGCNAATGPITNLGAIATFEPDFIIDDSNPADLHAYVSLRLVNRFDVTASDDTFANPEFELTTHVNLPSYSY